MLLSDSLTAQAATEFTDVSMIFENSMSFDFQLTIRLYCQMRRDLLLKNKYAISKIDNTAIVINVNPAPKPNPIAIKKQIN